MAIKTIHHMLHLQQRPQPGGVADRKRRGSGRVRMKTGPGTALLRQLFSIGKGVEDAMPVKDTEEFLFKGDASPSVGQTVRTQIMGTILLGLSPSCCRHPLVHLPGDAGWHTPYCCGPCIRIGAESCSKKGCLTSSSEEGRTGRGYRKWQKRRTSQVAGLAAGEAQVIKK